MDPVQLLARAYGEEDKVGTVGKDTYGHNCLTSHDVQAALRAGGANLMYGELLPAGLCKMLDAQHLSVPLKTEASTGGVELVLELGMGTGKIAMQVWLERAVQMVIGVELAASRTVVGVEAMHSLCATQGDRFSMGSDGATDCAGGGAATATSTASRACSPPRASVVEGSTGTGAGADRRLDFRTGDMFDPRVLALSEIRAAQAVIIQTCVPSTLFLKLARLLMQLSLGCKVVLFDSVDTIWHHALAQQHAEDMDAVRGGADDRGDDGDDVGAADGASGGIDQACVRVPVSAPLRQMACNTDEDADRFATSWSPTRGHHFHVYERVVECEATQQPVGDKAPSGAKQGASAGACTGTAGGDGSGDAARTEDAPASAAVAVGAAVEVLYSWLPTDTEEVQMFDGTEQWFRGWVTGLSVDVADGQSEDTEEAKEKPAKAPATTYCVLYDDGDVEENVPAWRMRVSAAAESRDDGDADAAVEVGGRSSPASTPARPAGARLVVTPPPAPTRDESSSDQPINTKEGSS